jgi:hypothetical protein
MRILRIFTAGLLGSIAILAGGCARYRLASYSLQFSDATSGRALPNARLDVLFPHEIFPLNAPETIKTNLNSEGSIVLLLPNHTPTWIHLRHKNDGTIYAFVVDLKAMMRDARKSLSMIDNYQRECRLVIHREPLP